MYNVKNVTESYFETIQIQPDGRCGGWYAINQGSSVTCEVNGYKLYPGDGHDLCKNLPPDVVWGSPINLLIPPGGEIRLTRLIYVKDEA